MKTEKMTDHQTETQRSLSWLKERQAREERDTRESFVIGGIRDYSGALARSTVSPTPAALLERESLLSGDDEKIAKVLSEVEVVDPHFDNLDISKPQDLTDATGLTAAKAEALGREFNDPEVKKELDRFANKVLRGVGGFLAGGRKKVLVVGLQALVLASCARLISTETVSLPSPAEPVVTEVASIPPEPTSTKEVPPTPVTIASGRPYPGSDAGFFLGAGGPENAEERLRELGAGPDIDKIWAMGVAEMGKSGINSGNIEWVTKLNELAENPSWTTIPRDRSTGHFLFPKITSGSEAGQLVRSGNIFAYLDREIGEDFFDWIELQSPKGIGEVEQRLIGDGSGWILVGAFNTEGEMLFWFNAEEDKWIPASTFKPEEAVKVESQDGKWVAFNDAGEVFWTYNFETEGWEEIEKLPTTCLDQELQEQVVEHFLEVTGNETLEGAIEAFKNNPNYDPSYSLGGLNKLTTQWAKGLDFLNLGGARISISHLPGGKSGDFVQCMFLGNPGMSGIITPVVVGIQRNGEWAQATTLFAKDYGEPPFNITTPEEFDGLIEDSIGESVGVGVILRFREVGDWNGPHSVNTLYKYEEPDVLKELMGIDGSYIQKYTKDPSLLGEPLPPRRDGTLAGEKADLREVIQELNPEVDPGLYISQVRFKEYLR